MRSFLVLTVGVGLLLWLHAPVCAEPTDLPEPSTGLRETTVRSLALGSPDELIRMRDAFDKTERELAREQLDLAPEGVAAFAEKAQRLKELQDRLVEAEVVVRLLDKGGGQMPAQAVESVSAEAPASVRDDLMRRMSELRVRIGEIEEAIRAEDAEYRRTLVEERTSLARLLAARRVELLAESARLLECHAGDRTCLLQKLRALCHLKLLSSGAERLPILRLIAEVDSRLNAPRHPEGAICENL